MLQIYRFVNNSLIIVSESPQVHASETDGINSVLSKVNGENLSCDYSQVVI